MQKFQVALLGLNNLFGSLSSLLLKQSPYIKWLKLYDDVNIGPAIDVSDINTACKVKSFLGKDQLHSALNDVDVAIIGDEGDLKETNDVKYFVDAADKIVNYANAISKTAPEAIVILAASPLNSLLPLLAKVLSENGTYNCDKVLGLTAPDYLCANCILAEHLKIDPKFVFVPVIGGSSDVSRVPILSQAKPNCSLSEDMLKNIIENIQTRDKNIEEAKGMREAINKAYGNVKFLNSVLAGLRGEINVIDIVMSKTDMVRGVDYFSLPAIFGRKGITKRFRIPRLTEIEERILADAIVNINKESEKAILYLKGITFNNKTSFVKNQEKSLQQKEIFDIYVRTMQDKDKSAIAQSNILKKVQSKVKKKKLYTSNTFTPINNTNCYSKIDFLTLNMKQKPSIINKNDFKDTLTTEKKTNDHKDKSTTIENEELQKDKLENVQKGRIIWEEFKTKQNNILFKSKQSTLMNPDSKTLKDFMNEKFIVDGTRFIDKKISIPSSLTNHLSTDRSQILQQSKNLLQTKSKQLNNKSNKYLERFKKRDILRKEDTSTICIEINDDKELKNNNNIDEQAIDTSKLTQTFYSIKPLMCSKTSNISGNISKNYKDKCENENFVNEPNLTVKETVRKRIENVQTIKLQQPKKFEKQEKTDDQQIKEIKLEKQNEIAVNKPEENLDTAEYSDSNLQAKQTNISLKKKNIISHIENDIREKLTKLLNRTPPFVYSSQNPFKGHIFKKNSYISNYLLLGDSFNNIQLNNDTVSKNVNVKTALQTKLDKIRQKSNDKKSVDLSLNSDKRIKEDLQTKSDEILQKINDKKHIGQLLNNDKSKTEYLQSNSDKLQEMIDKKRIDQSLNNDKRIKEDLPTKSDEILQKINDKKRIGQLLNNDKNKTEDLQTKSGKLLQNISYKKSIDLSLNNDKRIKEDLQTKSDEILQKINDKKHIGQLLNNDKSKKEYLQTNSDKLQEMINDKKRIDLSLNNDKRIKEDLQTKSDEILQKINDKKRIGQLLNNDKSKTENLQTKSEGTQKSNERKVVDLLLTTDKIKTTENIQKVRPLNKFSLLKASKRVPVKANETKSESVTADKEELSKKEEKLTTKLSVSNKLKLLSMPKNAADSNEKDLVINTDGDIITKNLKLSEGEVKFSSEKKQLIEKHKDKSDLLSNKNEIDVSKSIELNENNIAKVKDKTPFQTINTFSYANVTSLSSRKSVNINDESKFVVDKKEIIAENKSVEDEMKSTETIDISVQTDAPKNIKTESLNSRLYLYSLMKSTNKANTKQNTTFIKPPIIKNKLYLLNANRSKLFSNNLQNATFKLEDEQISLEDQNKTIRSKASIFPREKIKITLYPDTVVNPINSPEFIIPSLNLNPISAISYTSTKSFSKPKINDLRSEFKNSNKINKEENSYFKKSNTLGYYNRKDTDFKTTLKKRNVKSMLSVYSNLASRKSTLRKVTDENKLFTEAGKQIKYKGNKENLKKETIRSIKFSSDKGGSIIKPIEDKLVDDKFNESLINRSIMLYNKSKTGNINNFLKTLSITKSEDPLIIINKLKDSSYPNKNKEKFVFDNLPVNEYNKYNNFPSLQHFSQN